MKPLSWSFGHSDPETSSVYRKTRHMKCKMNEISHQLAINPAEILDQCVLNDDVGSVVVMETPCLNSTWSY